jgi:DNA-binding CsgD family transcriptional regulator
VRWGLSPDADLVYRALVTIGPGTGRWLAKDLGMSARRVETAVDELVAVSAVRDDGSESRRGRPVSAVRWSAVSPMEAVATLRRRNKRVVNLAHRTGFHRALLNNAGMAHQPTWPARVLVDRKETRPRIAELVAAERYEHLALNPERSFSADATSTALPLDRQLLARGVRLRTCGVPPEDGDASCGAAEQLMAMGAEYREVAQVPVKLMVFDRRVALLPVDPLDLSAGALEIDQPAIVAALVVLFKQLWSTARDPRKGGVLPIVLTPRERSIVGLLAEGHTDVVVAQRLGLSLRTIAYTLRGLMERLGVENRFQLGLALGAIGAAVPPEQPSDAGEGT